MRQKFLSVVEKPEQKSWLDQGQLSLARAISCYLWIKKILFEITSAILQKSHQSLNVYELFCCMYNNRKHFLSVK